MQPVSIAAPLPQYAACLQAAAEFGAPVAQRVAGKAGEALLRAAAAADPAERRTLIDASHLLARFRECLRNAYPGCLHREFAALDRQEALRSKPLSFEALELMGEEQVEETVEVVRGQQAVLSAVEAELATLNALVSAAKGRATVSAAANPLRPEAWVQALRSASLQCEVPPWALVRWLPRLSEALGPELASVYRQLAETLRRQGVSDAAYALGTATPARPPSPSALAPLLNLKDLRRLLVGEGERPGHSQWAPTDFGAPGAAGEPSAGETVGLTLPWALEALQDTQQLGQVMHRLNERRASGELASDAAAGGTPAQALGREVVRLMVETMAGDRRLLPQVRQVLRELEPALSRLASNDPRFFRDPHHPTRQFLTEMTERSLAWPTADLPGFAAFMEPLQQMAAALATMSMETAEPFEYALHSLEAAWSQQEERSRRERANAARALIKAERRNLLARRIAERLRQRPDVRRAPAVIGHFLTGPWAQVMAAAQMADPSGSDDAGGYGAVADDLLWTTQREVAAESRPSLAKLVPPMVAALRGGLASIEYPEEKSREFLRELAELHRLAMQAADGQPADAPPAHAAVLPDDEREHEFWLEPTEARESSLMEAVPAADREAVSQHAPLAADGDAEPGDTRAPLAIEHLQAGAWVDLFLDGAWSRWRLAWASPQLLLFMFADGAGKYRSMTRSVLETLIAIGALRLVSGQTILAGALDAVAEAALLNSTESVR
ncbi:MAG TPA: DUF1631 family protein [Ramlibacter sp.]